MKNNQLILLLTILFASPVYFCEVSFAQKYEWTQKANYGGGGTYDPFYFVLNDKGYVGTGRMLSGGGVNKNDFWKYDPVTDTWAQMANFPGTPRYGAKGFAIGNFGYAGTGWDPSAKQDFYKYDPASNSWSAISNFNGSARYTSTTFSIGNKGYLGLGYSPCKNDFWQYDPATNLWTQIASLPGGIRQAATAVTWKNLAFVGFGSCNTNIYKDWYMYNPSLNSWFAKTPLPGPARSSTFSFTMGDTVYVGMGNNYENNSQPFSIFTDMWKYNISTDSWSQLPDHPGGKRYEGVSFSINNKGYIGLGSDTSFNTHFLSDFWEYSLDNPINTPVLPKITCDLNPHSSPATGTLLLRAPGGTFQAGDKLQIITSNGKIVKVDNAIHQAHTAEIDLTAVGSGLYFVRMVRNGMVVSVCKFIRV